MLVCPSHALGGRAMEIIKGDELLDRYMSTAVEALPYGPIVVDKVPEEAIEVDVDAICDGKVVVIGAVMGHIEEAAGTWRALTSKGIEVERVNEVHEGRPHIVDMIRDREIGLVFTAPYGKHEHTDDPSIRVAAGITCITTLGDMRATVSDLTALQRGPQDVRSAAGIPRATEAKALGERPQEMNHGDDPVERGRA